MRPEPIRSLAALAIMSALCACQPARGVPSADGLVADVGGVQMLLPRSQAHLIETDPDPSGRTVVNSFGYEFRFQATAAAARSAESAPTYPVAIEVGVQAASRYGEAGDAFLNTMGDLENKSIQRFRPANREIRRVDEVFGLVHYTSVAPSGAAPGTVLPSYADESFYVHRDSNGAVDAYVECDNGTEGHAQCTEDFFAPRPIRARLAAQFPKTCLGLWRSIAADASALLVKWSQDVPAH